MHAQNRTFYYLSLIAVILAFSVVILGAYTRLTDAGLGCPDWPGCYGQVTVPETSQQIQRAQQAFPNAPIQQTKAWTEMIHRYAAGTLGLLILILFFMALAKRKVTDHQPIIVPILLVGLVIFQALLGMWTVTEKLLPIVVMGHLLGGITILALLWLVNLRLANCSFVNGLAKANKFQFWAGLGILFVAIQIVLGGWTSSNYAALACPNFPACFINHPMTWNFAAAFSLLTPVGHMSQSGLMTIQMVHRIWGFFTFAYVGLLSLIFLFNKTNAGLRNFGVIMLLLLISQIVLGILNVAWMLPLSIALAHNAIAALLLLTMVTLSFGLSRHQSEA